MKRRGTYRRRRRLSGGVTFKNKPDVREYAIPDFSNLFNSTNEREINENIVAYYNERLPFSNLISSKGQTKKYETRRIRNARDYFASQGMPQAEINARMAAYKQRVSRLVNLEKHLSNLRNSTNNFNNYKNINIPAALVKGKNLVHPETAPGISKYSPENVELVKGIMQRKANNELSASSFGHIYDMINVTNNNTDETIRNKFLNIIKNDTEEPYKTYLTRRIYQYHRD
jgi:hypothetical protein